jgi:hypothetical protein
MATPTTPKTIDLRRFLPPPQTITFPDGSVHTPVFSARVAELYREVQDIARAMQAGTLDDALKAQDTIDACFELAYPSATPDNLASLKTYTDLKLVALAAAAGRVDDMLAELEKHAPKAEATEGAPLSPPAMSSAP